MSRIAVKTYFVDDQKISLHNIQDQPIFRNGFEFNKPEQIGYIYGDPYTAFLKAQETLSSINGYAIVYLDLIFKPVHHKLIDTDFEIIPAADYLKDGSTLIKEAAGLCLLDTILRNGNFKGGVIVISTACFSYWKNDVPWLLPTVMEKFRGRRISIEFGISSQFGDQNEGYKDILKQRINDTISNFLKLFDDTFFYLSPPCLPDHNGKPIEWFGLHYHTDGDIGYLLHLHSIKNRYSNAKKLFFDDRQLKTAFNHGGGLERIVNEQADLPIKWEALLSLFDEEISFVNVSKAGSVTQSDKDHLVVYHSAPPNPEDATSYNLHVPILPAYPFLLCLKQLYDELKKETRKPYFYVDLGEKFFIGFRNERASQCVSSFSDLQEKVRNKYNDLKNDPNNFRKSETNKRITSLLARLLACAPFVPEDVITINEQTKHLYPLLDSSTTNNFGLVFAKRDVLDKEYIGVEWSRSTKS
jgi:hypothetical protein